MRQKGISDIITIIILLLVAVSLAGAFFIWAGRSTATLTESAGAQINTTSQALGQRVRVDAGAGNNIVIRNIGSASIPVTSLGVFINGSLATCTSWTPSGQIGVNGFSTCSTSGQPLGCSPGATIKVTSAGGEATEICK